MPPVATTVPGSGFLPAKAAKCRHTAPNGGVLD